MVAITPTITPTVTPEVVDKLTGSAYIDTILTSLFNVDFMLVVKLLAGWLVIAWLLTVIWVFKDAYQRYDSLYMPTFWALIVLPFNLLGLFAYIILRPSEYFIDKEQEEYDLKLLEGESLRFVECPVCGAINDRKGDYCTECGAHLTGICPKCGNKVWVDFHYCKYCGQELTIDVFDTLANLTQNTELNIKNMPVSSRNEVYEKYEEDDIKQKKVNTQRGSSKNKTKSNQGLWNIVFSWFKKQLIVCKQILLNFNQLFVNCCKFVAELFKNMLVGVWKVVVAVVKGVFSFLIKIYEIWEYIVLSPFRLLRAIYNLVFKLVKKILGTESSSAAIKTRSKNKGKKAGSKKVRKNKKSKAGQRKQENQKKNRSEKNNT